MLQRIVKAYEDLVSRLGKNKEDFYTLPLQARYEIYCALLNVSEVPFCDFLPRFHMLASLGRQTKEAELAGKSTSLLYQELYKHNYMQKLSLIFKSLSNFKNTKPKDINLATFWEKEYFKKMEPLYNTYRRKIPMIELNTVENRLVLTGNIFMEFKPTAKKLFEDLEAIADSLDDPVEESFRRTFIMASVSSKILTYEELLDEQLYRFSLASLADSLFN